MSLCPFRKGMSSVLYVAYPSQSCLSRNMLAIVAKGNGYLFLQALSSSAGRGVGCLAVCTQDVVCIALIILLFLLNDMGIADMDWICKYINAFILIELRTQPHLRGNSILRQMISHGKSVFIHVACKGLFTPK